MLWSARPGELELGLEFKCPSVEAGDMEMAGKLQADVQSFTG